MKVKELIENLKEFNQEHEVLVSSDEELNTLFKGFRVDELTLKENEPIEHIVFYGLSGEELNEE